MKKLLSIILTLLMLVGILASCGNYESPDENPDDTGSNDEATGGEDSELENDPAMGNKPTVPPIEIEYDAEREAKDNEFSFDSIVVERYGYDIVAAGRYYGNDFDNVKYYGSYYRIIDNYDDFSTLTAWGNKIDKSVFNDNFILVLHTYKKCDLYYSHSDFNKLNQKGQFGNFDVDLQTGELEIFEFCSTVEPTLDIDGYIPPKLEDYTVVFPTEKQETIYLVIPKDEMPSNLPINGEISFYEVIDIAE